MEFGKLEDIHHVNWTLPHDDPSNDHRIYGLSKTNLFLGAPAWGCHHWKGKIYPAQSEREEFLYHYSRKFNCIELNTTHYRLPSVQTGLEWASQVPSHFLFCPKIPKLISHANNEFIDPQVFKRWFLFLESLKNNLGPCFIQFHESFSYRYKNILFSILQNWPPDFKLSLELRHPSWFEHNKLLPALADYLHKKGIGVVITDVAGRRDVLHTSRTTDWSMIRLIGNDLAPSDELRLKDWSHRLREWQLKGLKDAYLLLHQPDDIWTIEFAQMAQKILFEKGLKVPAIDFWQERNLFNQ